MSSTTYSPIFTSGLYLASTGRESPDSPILPPPSTPLPPAKATRRRRSSLTIASTTPIAALKSPTRAASFARHQALIKSPVRDRAAHMALHAHEPLYFDGHDDTGFSSLKDSGSSSSTSLSRVRARRSPQALQPARPAPTTPLPALPISRPPSPSRASTPQALDSTREREPLSTHPYVPNASMPGSDAGPARRLISGDALDDVCDMVLEEPFEIDGDMGYAKENVGPY